MHQSNIKTISSVNISVYDDPLRAIYFHSCRMSSKYMLDSTAERLHSCFTPWFIFILLSYSRLMLSPSCVPISSLSLLGNGVTSSAGGGLGLSV
jgi:hypothetical protein